MTKRTILVQFDTDPHPSVFDRVVAIDAGVDELFSYGGVEPDAVESLVHGAMFTRGGGSLRSTAFFVGGRNVARAEELLHAITRVFFGPVRNSVMLDPNGANTTAAAAVLAASRHLDLAHTKALLLGGTGPVGQRIALLLARQKAAVWLGSRTIERAADACQAVRAKHPDAHLFPVAVGEPLSVREHPEKFHLVVSAAAAGQRLLFRDHLAGHHDLKVLVDLNAVPPTGIEGVEVTDAGREVGGIFHYGALGVGGTKMKIHRAAVAKLFTANDLILDAEEIFQIGLEIHAAE